MADPDTLIPADRSQVRVLPCEEPGLLAWVIGLGKEPFGPREQQILDAVAPALLRRIKIESILAAGEPARVLLEAVVERLDRPAFVLNGQHVLIANAAGRAILSTDRQRTLHSLKEATRSESHPDFEVTRHKSPGTPDLCFAVSSAIPTIESKLASAGGRWNLSPRQIRVLRLLVTGLGNKRISAALRCTDKNVEFHVSNLLKRTGCENRAKLLAEFWTHDAGT